MSEQSENCTWLLCGQKLLTSVKCKPVGVNVLIVLCKSFPLQLTGALLHRSVAVFRETAQLAEEASQRMPQSAPAQQSSPGALHRPLTLAIAERAKAKTLW